MRDFHSELSVATEYSPVYLYTDPAEQTALTPEEIRAATPLHRYAALSDYDTILLRHDGYDPTDDYKVSVDNPQDFARLLKAAVEHFGVEGYDLEGSLEHESRHADAWHALGAESCVYSVEVSRYATSAEAFYKGDVAQTTFTPGVHTAGNLRVPMIGLVSMNLRPIDPSPGDMSKVYSLGIKDVSQAARRIQGFNDTHPDGPRLLLPLSYDPEA
jgi:hypothetical protein